MLRTQIKSTARRKQHHRLPHSGDRENLVFGTAAPAQIKSTARREQHHRLPHSGDREDLETLLRYSCAMPVPASCQLDFALLEKHLAIFVFPFLQGS